MASNANVVLVHGAFCDGSSWEAVIPLLQQAGHHVITVQLPLTSLADDILTTQQALASLSGPTVLVGHSYGGAVVTGAGAEAANVTALVYVAAYVPDEGETVGDLNNRVAATEGLQQIGLSYLKDAVWINPEQFPRVFAADVDPVRARVLASVQKPTGFGCLNQKMGTPAWKKLPAWYLVSQQDMTISPELERWMAQRIHATTQELASSHASLISHAQEVAETIMAAARATATTSIS